MSEGHLDKLDITILRELTQAQTVLPGRPGLSSSYREVARKIGFSAGTVRNRINSMYSSGVLIGSSVYPNPNFLGLKAGAFAIDSSPLVSKSDVVDGIRSIDGVYFIQNFHGAYIGIAFVYQDEESLSNKLASFRKATGAEDGMFTRVVYPPCRDTLTVPEWKLVASLTRGRFQNYDKLARELNISVRTLKRRLSRITAVGAILSVPNMDYTAISGGVPADLIVSFADLNTRSETERRIIEVVKDYTIYAGVWESFGMYSMILPKVVTATQIANKVRRAPGVKMARVEIVDEHFDTSIALADHAEKHAINIPQKRSSKLGPMGELITSKILPPKK